MNTSDKIGQMFMLGFDGNMPSFDIIEIIHKYKIGGVILFERNIESPVQLRELTTNLQKLSKEIPLFISIDEEGGEVSRLKPPFKQFPSPFEIGKTDSENEAYIFGKRMAEELKLNGINMNLAPVLDVNTNPRNPVIGKRSFGNSPELVSRLGVSVIRGMRDAGIIPCGKHFPGHGGTEMDSHRCIPSVNKNKEELEDVEMRPFRYAIENGLDVIMTAHVLYPSLDTKFPATLSKKIIKGLLRKELNFQGMVITDDMGMGAISEASRDIDEASLMAVSAGVDIILICHNSKKQLKAIDYIMKSFYEGSLSEERIDLSFRRILKIKKKYILHS